MGSLLTGLLGNGVLAVALFMSIYMAAGWGEMAGIRGGGDKSGLGGLFAMLMLMGIRWAAVALLLLLAVWRGLFDFLPGGRWPGVGIVLGAHLLLGLVSYLGFNWVAEGLTADRFGPQRWSPLFGILLPLPALFVAGWAVNRDFLARHPRLGLVLAVAIALGHVALYRQRYESMRRPPQAVRVEHSLPSS